MNSTEGEAYVERVSQLQQEKMHDIQHDRFAYFQENIFEALLALFTIIGSFRFFIQPDGLLGSVVGRLTAETYMAYGWNSLWFIAGCSLLYGILSRRQLFEVIGLILLVAASFTNLLAIVLLAYETTSVWAYVAAILVASLVRIRYILKEV